MLSIFGFCWCSVVAFVPPLGGTVGYWGVVPVGILCLFRSCCEFYWFCAAGVFFFDVGIGGYIFSK